MHVDDTIPAGRCKTTPTQRTARMRCGGAGLLKGGQAPDHRGTKPPHSLTWWFRREKWKGAEAAVEQAVSTLDRLSSKVELCGRMLCNPCM